MSNVFIKKLVNEDILEVYKIENELLGKVNLESIKKSLDSDSLSYYVLKNKDEIIGFYEVSIVSPEAELFDICIVKKYQGRGYSKQLIEHLISLCESCGVSTIFLEVNSINQRAIALYKKFNFEPYSVRKNYYGENDAILMKKVL